MKKISMFIPCLVDLVLPHIGENTATLLGHLDCEPIYHPEQTCCGLMSFNSGYRDEARRLARHFIRVFENDDLIVSPSGSCVNMVKNRYKNLFDEDPGWRKRAAELAPRVYELSQFIVDHLGWSSWAAATRPKSPITSRAAPSTPSVFRPNPRR